MLDKIFKNLLLSICLKGDEACIKHVPDISMYINGGFAPDNLKSLTFNGKSGNWLWLSSH